jgi:prophage DNA circulation protein
MSEFDKLKPMSFAGIKFPYKEYSVKGAYRKHVHEYPHVAGGAPEKLGRTLYEVTVSVDFRADLQSAAAKSKKYTQLITDLGVLRTLWENGDTAELHIPHIGTVKMFADGWNEKVKNTDRSNVATDITFLEDQESAFLVLEALQVKTSDFNDAAFALQGMPKSEESLWSKINNAITSVLSIRDQAQLYGSLFAAKIEGLTSLLRQADETLDELNDPGNNDLLQALHRLWAATLSLKNDLQEQDDYLREYTVPVAMTVGQAAAAIYGDSSRGGELMQLNVLADPLNLQPGSSLRYYVQSAAA